MPSITNIERLKNKLSRLENKHRKDGTLSVVVGYTANYGVHVHERPARHAPGKQSKFLEQPARELSSQMGGLMAKSLSSGVPMLKSLYLIGMRLQRDSQRIVPIDTGNLRGSAFTAREDELMSVMAASEGKIMRSQQGQKEKWNKKTAKQKANYRKRKRKKMSGYKKS